MIVLFLWDLGAGGAGVIILMSPANPHSKMSKFVNHRPGGRGN